MLKITVYRFLISCTILVLASCTTKYIILEGNKIKQNKFAIFILMGQSNMAGFGYLLPDDSIPMKNVYKLPTIYKDNLAWKPAGHPLHNRHTSDRFGMGLPFAQKYLYDHPGVSIGLIPLAYGGAGIDALKKGSKVYDDFLVKLAFAQKAGIIKGVLWHQGESDTVSEELAAAYQTKLDQLIADIRSDTKMPNLPFIAGNLAEFYGTGVDHNSPKRVAQINKVKETLRTLPKRVKNTSFVESDGAKSIDNHMVHFDRDAYILLGHRYYEKYLQMGGK